MFDAFMAGQIPKTTPTANETPKAMITDAPSRARRNHSLLGDY